jgi:hypothetical protein
MKLESASKKKQNVAGPQPRHRADAELHPRYYSKSLAALLRPIDT